MARKNQLGLNDFLFEQMERLNEIDDDDIKKGKMKDEIARAEAMNKIAAQIIANGALELKAMETFSKVGGKIKIKTPEMFGHIEALPAPPKK